MGIQPILSNFEICPYQEMWSMIIQPLLHIDLYDHGLGTMRPASAKSEMSNSPGFFVCFACIYIYIYLSILVPFHGWYLADTSNVSFLGETSQDRFNSCVRLESLRLLAIFQQLLTDAQGSQAVLLKQHAIIDLLVLREFSGIHFIAIKNHPSNPQSHPFHTKHQ